MSDKDRCCSLAPYFKVHRGKLTAFKKMLQGLHRQNPEEARLHVLRVQKLKP